MYPPFWAHLATQVCTGIKQNQFSYVFCLQLCLFCQAHGDGVEHGILVSLFILLHRGPCVCITCLSCPVPNTVAVVMPHPTQALSLPSQPPPLPLRHKALTSQTFAQLLRSMQRGRKHSSPPNISPAPLSISKTSWIVERVRNEDLLSSHQVLKLSSAAEVGYA